MITKIIRGIMIFFGCIFLLMMMYMCLFVPTPYPTSEKCPDDPEGYTDSNGIYHLDSIHQARWDYRNK